MHIPDGFLSTPVWAALDVASLPAIGFIARRAESGLKESAAPLLGVMGAFVFAAQMINFPVGVGTSGHLVGSALLTFTVGPAAAVVVMTAILAVQALMFQDGGLLALGANVFNMAVAGVAAAYLPYRYLAGGSGSSRTLGVFLGGFASVVAASSLALAELRVSGVPMPMAVVGISAALFVVSALIEGAITVVVVRAIGRMNPEWVRKPQAESRSRAFIGLAAILLGAVGALFASELPDGLEKLAQKLGIESRSINVLASPMADYEWKWFTAGWAQKMAAALAGLLLTYILLKLLSRVFARGREH
ncbi:MAG: energy-coupling factor ABC transporter permease [Bryobacterales bacterium]|nr:energy-coupling factor ABC transporter permease [Bryobacterales bacterium]